MTGLKHDPFNLIVSGVGGQGNVLASRILGEMLTRQGYCLSIGEIFGASQRGGSVMSHVRISQDPRLAPRIPEGTAHVLLSLEPAETLKILKDFGNPEILVISNTRPVHPIGVISGEQDYPALPDIESWVEALSETSWFIPASDRAVALGNPVLANAILIGALAGTALLPLHREVLEEVLAKRMDQEKVQANLQAFDAGTGMTRPLQEKAPHT